MGVTWHCNYPGLSQSAPLLCGHYLDSTCATVDVNWSSLGFSEGLVSIVFFRGIILAAVLVGFLPG